MEFKDELIERLSSVASLIESEYDSCETDEDLDEAMTKVNDQMFDFMMESSLVNEFLVRFLRQEKALLELIGEAGLIMQ